MNHRQHTTRRGFLQTSAAAALAIAGAAPDIRAADKDDFGGFIMGVQSYTFRNFDLEPALKRIQELGLHYVEFYQKHAPLEASPDQIAALLKLCKSYEITPVAW